MDSLERLGSSVAQVALLVQGLRRERGELAARLAKAATERHEAEEALRAELVLTQGQVARFELEQQATPTLEKRAQQAELESAQLAQQLDDEKRRFFREKAALEEQVASLEAQLSAAKELNEILPGESLELELKSKQIEELSRTNEALNREKEALLSERAGAEARAQADAAARAEGTASELQGLRESAAKAEAEKFELRRQKRELAGVAKERELMRRKLQEVHETLASLRLTS